MKIIGRRKNPSGMSHPRIPPIIELRCKCGSKVTCIHPANKRGLADTPDGYYGNTEDDKSFTAKCDACSFAKENLSYFDLTKIGDPFYLTSVGHVAIWGWNKEHLKMVIAFLEGKNIQDNPWSSYQKYIPGKWKSSSRKRAFVKAAKKIINSYRDRDGHR